MNHAITLYGLGPTRSSRCQWTLLELGLEFEFIEDRSLIGSDELKPHHPQAKFPAIVIDGESLFESAAICTHLCDLVPAAGLLGAAGTRARALHNQWTAFCLSEMEAYLWHTRKTHEFLSGREARTGGRGREQRRVSQCCEGAERRAFRKSVSG